MNPKLYLTGKQAHLLRGLGHHLSPVAMIGKEGITDNLVAGVEEVLNVHELIKVRIQDGCPLERAEAAEQLAEKTKGRIAQSIGKIFLLYRESQYLPEDKKIHLPRKVGVADEEAAPRKVAAGKKASPRGKTPSCAYKPVIRRREDREAAERRENDTPRRTDGDMSWRGGAEEGTRKPEPRSGAKPWERSDSRSESEPRSDRGARPGGKSGAKPWERSGSRSESEPGSERGARPGGKSSARPWQKSGPRSESEPGSDRGSKPGNRQGTKPGSKPWERSGSRSESEPGSDRGSRPGARPGGRPGSKPGERSGSRPGSESDSKSGARPWAKPGSKVGGRAGARPGSKPGTRAGAKPGTKPRASRPAKRHKS